MASLPLPRMTLQQYLEREDRSEVRHEFFAGEVFEMEAASFRHQRITARFSAATAATLEAMGCELHTHGTRIATSKDGLYTYPELIILCGQPKFLDADPNTLANPKAIVEILSPSTKDYDRGTKFQLYRGLASLEEYINIHQDSPYIEHHFKQPDGTWAIRDLRGLDATLRLASLDIEIPFTRLWAGIEFDAA